MKAEQVALEELIRPVVEGQGYDFLGITFRRERGVSILRITIDRKPDQGFVSHADCSIVSKEVSLVLDVHDPLPGHYTLEVSSPGVERPLLSMQDYKRFMGHLVKIRKKGISLTPNERRNYVGWIRDVSLEQVIIELEDTKESLPILFREIDKANLVVRF